MLDARPFSRRTMTRLFAVLVAVMQLVLVGAPLVDADAGRVASTHVEEQGVRLHWTHDAAECAGCAARHLVATPPAPPIPRLLLAEPAPRVERETESPARRLLLASRQSRAPPSV